MMPAQRHRSLLADELLSFLQKRSGCRDPNALLLRGADGHGGDLMLKSPQEPIYLNDCTRQRLDTCVALVGSLVSNLRSAVCVWLCTAPSYWPGRTSIPATTVSIIAVLPAVYGRQDNLYPHRNLLDNE